MKTRSGSGPSVVLIVDQPQRDLAGLVLTAAELSRRGITCHLVGASQRWSEIFAIRPDFVLLFNLRKTQTRLARALERAGIRFGLLDHEGAVWRSLDDYTVLLSTDQRAREAADVICSWSPVLQEQLVSGGWFSAERFRLTGCPRFDFYHPDWRSVVSEGCDAPTAGGAKRILLAPNYVDANSRFLSEEEVRRELRELLGISAPGVEQRLADQRRGVKGFMELARAIATDFPESVVVIRPHPFENPEVYAEGLRDLTGVEINTTGPPQVQLFRAAVVVQRSSTIGIEGRLAEVPSFSPRWIPPPHPEVGAVESVSVQLDSYQEFRGALASLLAGAFRLPPDVAEASRTVIRERFYKVDGLAHQRVADAVLEHLPKARRIDERLCERLLYGLEADNLGPRKRLARSLRWKAGLPPTWSFRAFRDRPETAWEGTDQYFDVASVERVLARIRAAEADRAVRPASVEVLSTVRAQAYANGHRGTGVTLRPA